MLLVIHDKFWYLDLLFTFLPAQYTLNLWPSVWMAGHVQREKKGWTFPLKMIKCGDELEHTNVFIFFYNLITLSQSTPSFPTPCQLRAESSLIHKKLQYLMTYFFLHPTEN